MCNYSQIYTNSAKPKICKIIFNNNNYIIFHLLTHIFINSYIGVRNISIKNNLLARIDLGSTAGQAGSRHLLQVTNYIILTNYFTRYLSVLDVKYLVIVLFVL